MKLLRNCLGGCIIALFVTTCNILDHEPKLAVSGNNLIHDEQSAQTALNGLYRQLKGGEGHLEGNHLYGAYFYLMSDLSSDISQQVGTRNELIELDTYDTSVDNPAVEGMWEESYKGINQANLIISKVSDLDKIDQQAKEKIMGQAYFIRALLYFELNRSFGGVKGVYGTMGVPIKLKPTRSLNDINYPSRASIDETYEQVESDLNQAIELLPKNFSSSIKASQAAAKALLSRLYLYYEQDYSLVEQYATKVINDYNYKLTENYADIFIEEETAGSIFELAFNTQNNSKLRYWYFPTDKGGRGEVVLHKNFANLLLSRPNDERTKLISKKEGSKIYYPTKYQKPDESDNIQILRLAELYFNRAEARVRQSNPNLKGALSDLNVIRNRAGLPDTTGSGVDTPQEVLDAITLERRIEFFEEGHRWFNLLRTGRALTVLKDINRLSGSPVSLDAVHEVWPIPSHAIDANKNLKQNDGY